jgi:CubicO group peptidase (beta-lactamase class C family)
LPKRFPQLKQAIHSDYHTVTLRQLLYHRAGLPEDRAPDPALFLRLRSLEGEMRRQRLDATKVGSGEKACFCARHAQFAYSNFGYMVAGAMLEQVAQRSWEQLLQEHLFKPLRMRTAGFGPPKQIAGHNGKPPRPQMFDNPPVLGPAGTVHCSLRDWAAFAQLHLCGARGEKTAHAAPRLIRRLACGSLPDRATRWGGACARWILNAYSCTRAATPFGSPLYSWSLNATASTCAPTNWGHADATGAVLTLIQSLSTQAV